jgi:methyltransferase (TIGR00027 family)
MKNRESSATALLILRGQVFVSRDPRFGALMNRPWVETCERFLRASDPGAETYLRRVGQPWYRALHRAAERALVPGITLHYVVRKRHIEDQVRKALADGFQRVIVIGAGFDTLCSRLKRELPRAAFVEVDHPATQEAKAKIADLGCDLVPVDLARDSLSDKLPLGDGKRTVFVLEGVTMYLAQERVESVLRYVRERGGPGSRVVFTFMEPDQQGRLRFQKASPLVHLWLQRKGEPFTWGLPRGGLPAFLEPLGLRALEIVDGEVLRARYLKTDDALAPGECIAVAEAM